MKINNILYLVGKYLTNNDLLSELSSSYVNSENSTILNYYINLINTVQKRIAIECFSLRCRETFEIKSQQPFLFKELNRQFHKIIKITQNDKPVRFDLVENGVLLPDGEYEIWYQYLPIDVVDYDSDVQDFNGKISERMFALGVCAEDCLIKGMYDTSDFFEQKFIRSVNSIKTTSPYKNMPKRRWL